MTAMALLLLALLAIVAAPSALNAYVLGLETAYTASIPTTR